MREGGSNFPQKSKCFYQEFVKKNPVGFEGNLPMGMPM